LRCASVLCCPVSSGVVFTASLVCNTRMCMLTHLAFIMFYSRKNITKCAQLLLITCNLIIKANGAPPEQLYVHKVEGGGGVVNGSTPLAVLDCQYSVPAGRVAGLVVKWYKDSNPRPVYQWIAGSSPQALGPLAGRLDLRYTISPDPLRGHSALAFVSPTTELSGNYTCKVATYYEEGSATGTLLVYAPAKEFELKLSRPSYRRVSTACRAEGLFPEPELRLRRTDGGTARETPMNSKIRKVFEPATSSYTVSAEATLHAFELSQETEFECRIFIPGTQYVVMETKIYYTGGGRSAASDRAATSGLAVADGRPCGAVLLLALASCCFL